MAEEWRITPGRQVLGCLAEFQTVVVDQKSEDPAGDMMRLPCDFGELLSEYCLSREVKEKQDVQVFKEDQGLRWV